jgi:hypothetical protein
MTALTPAERERQRPARARASRIREGIVNYLETLAVIAEAWNQDDWRTLGYPSWDAYVDSEFGAERLRLPAEHRQKAVAELRLTTDMSARAIAKAVNADQRSVRRDIASGAAGAAPDGDVRGTDGRTYAARSPLVEAMTGAIEDAAERIETAGAGLGGPAPAPDHPGTSDAPGETESAGNTSEPEEPLGTTPGSSSAAPEAVPPAASGAPDSSRVDGLSGEEGEPAGTGTPSGTPTANGAPSLGFSDPTAAASPASDAAAPQDHLTSVADGAGPGEAADVQPAAAAAGAGTHVPAAPEHPDAVSVVPGEGGALPSPPEQGGPAPFPPAGPSCEKCGGEILPGQAAAGYTRCDPCDPEGDHVDDGNGCKACAAVREVEAAYAPLSLGDGVIECGECDGVAAELTPGRSLLEVLTDARDHVAACTT